MLIQRKSKAIKIKFRLKALILNHNLKFILKITLAYFTIKTLNQKQNRKINL